METTNQYTILSRNDSDIGWIEVKDIGKQLNSKDYKGQFDSYPVALRSNYCE